MSASSQESPDLGLTSVHGPEHACDELIDAITLMNEWDQCRDSAFVVCTASEMREYQFLKRVYLVLKRHEV